MLNLKSVSYVYFQPKYYNQTTISYFKVNGIKRETKKAVCFILAGTGDLVWFPKAALHNLKDQVCNIEVKRWFGFDDKSHKTFVKNVMSI